MEHKCPKCSGEMEVGFILDRGYNNFLPAEWIAGEPETGWFGGVVKTSNRDRLWTDAWRCKNCGFLELYALRPRET